MNTNSVILYKFAQTIQLDLAYEKYLRWTGIAVASPFILFILLCILIYIPPIQNFLVNTATRYASEATGMQISIGRISLSFPLDLVVNNTVIIDKQDTILNAKKLTAKIQLTPLLRKKIELDGLELSKASVNTANLIEGMTLKGNLGELFVSSHSVELDPETAIVNTLSLKDTHLSICMADTTASDTTSSQPVFWKIQLKMLISKTFRLPCKCRWIHSACQHRSKSFLYEMDWSTCISRHTRLVHLN